MFPKDSCITQIKPETVCQLVSEAEEQQWRQIEYREREESEIEQEDLPQSLLSHGTGVKKINKFFSNLESRKFCMLLAGRKSTQGTFHLVNTNRSQEEDSFQRKKDEEHAVNQLDNKDFQAFKHAYLCATYPVLGAPDPPSPFTPSPIPSDTESRRFTYNTSKSPLRPTTPYSLQDSGVEDQDEMAVIPTETLCDILQKSFGLSASKYHQYEKIIISSSNKKSAQKLLAEELVGQLTALENNSNPFYNPHTFLTRNGYDIWQQYERKHVSQHLDKFWQFSLPFPSGLQESVSMKKASPHKDYCTLLNKLLKYETKSKWEEYDIDKPLYGLLSSASLRLLKEFGLRYGIGEQYRRIVYLKYLTEKFTFNIWFLHHIVCVLIGIYDMLPSNRSNLVMVREEYLMLDECVQGIIVQSSKAITQMKTLFPNNKPKDGIELLLELISGAQDMKSYLSLERKPLMKHYLFSLVQEIFKPAFENHKMMAKSDLEQKRKRSVCPKLLNILINDIRDEITDYKTNYQQTFERYFDITELAAQAFYLLLMKDIEKFLDFEKTSKPMDINLLMLGLAYRLNQLDQDLKQYIPPQTQIWRTIFQGEIIQWAIAFKIHLKDLVVTSVGADKFVNKQIHLDRPLSQMSTIHSSRRSFSASFTFTPSINSAFSSVASSMRSSPCFKQPVHKTAIIPELETTSNTELKSGSQNVRIPIKFKAVYRYDTQSLNSNAGHIVQEEEDRGECLTFGSIRHSSSLPDIVRGTMNSSGQNQEFIDADESTVEQTTHGNSKNVSYLNERQVCDLSPTGREFSLADSYNIERVETDDEEVESDMEESLDNFMRSCEGVVDIKSDVSPVSERGDYNFPDISQITHNDGSRPVNDDTHNKESDPSKGLFSRIYSVFLSPQLSDTSTLPTASKDDITSLSADTPVFGGADPKNDFLDSLASDFSNMTLPDLPNSDAILPLSGSLIDMLVILQRNVYFVQMLSDIVYPALNTDGFPDVSSDTILKLEFEQLQAKQNTYTRFLKSMRETVCLYVDNMLCMDLCGIKLSNSKKVIGPKLVEHIQTQQMSEVLWGCRHQINNVDCRQYIDKQTVYLCDRYEPVTEQMCIRINNVHAMYRVLSFYEQKLYSVMNIDKDDFLSEEKQPQCGRESQMSITSNFSMIDSVSGCDDDVRFKKPLLGKGEILNSYQTHIMSVLKAMVRLLTFRLNLFVKDAIPLLLRLRLKGVTVYACLQPLTEFLSNHLTSLSKWLYKECFKLVQEHLWIFIVQCFETEADKLKKEDTGSQQQAENFIQALTYLMKFMNNNEKGIPKKLLLAQAEDVILKLQLYTLSTYHILTLYRTLTQKSDEHDFNIHIEPAMSALLYKVTCDLESRSKCFSGHILINWLIHHKSLVQKIDPVYNEGPFYREKAVDFCQKLLTLQILIDVDVNVEDRSMTPLSISSLDCDYYPGVTIYSHNLHHSNYSSEEDEVTPVPSPVTSPISNVTPTTSYSPIKKHNSNQTQVYVNVQINEVQSLDKVPNIVCDQNLDMDVQENVYKGSTVNISPKGSEASSEKCHPFVDEFHHEIVNKSLQATEDVSERLSENVVTDKPPTQQQTVKLPLLHSGRMSNSGSNRTLSFNSSSSGNRMVQFFDKKYHFYHVSETYAYGNNFSTIKTQEPGNQVDSSEMVNLAEQCFLKKIYPIALLAIIYSRRKQDSNAKHIIKQLPRPVVYEIRNYLDIPCDN